jgi:hypothetical protein
MQYYWALHHRQLGKIAGKQEKNWHRIGRVIRAMEAKIRPKDYILDKSVSKIFRLQLYDKLL